MSHIIINKSFYLVMASLITIFLLFLFLNPQGLQLNVFFAKTDDFLADFFNVQIYIADWDPYHNEINGLGEKCYLPLTYLFLELFNGFYDYSGASLVDCYASTSAIASAFLLMAFSLLILYHSLSCISGLSAKMKFVLFFSSVVFFSVERGNMIILCVALLCYFFAFMNADNKWLRYFALVCLCVASVIKVYPALLGLYILEKRRFKAVAGCVILSLCLIFLPFLFFHGQFENIVQLLSNVANNSDSYSPFKIFPRFGLMPLIAWSLRAIHVEEGVSQMIMYIPQILMVIACSLSMFLFFYEKSNWKKMALLVLPLIMYPTNSAFYCGLYFIPVILLFLSSNEGRRMDLFYMLLICVFMNPLQIGVIKSINISQLFSNIALLLMWFILLIESANSYMARKKSLK